jgi:hypothetical protein
MRRDVLERVAMRMKMGTQQDGRQTEWIDITHPLRIRSSRILLGLSNYRLTVRASRLRPGSLRVRRRGMMTGATIGRTKTYMVGDESEMMLVPWKPSSIVNVDSR